MPFDFDHPDADNPSTSSRRRRKRSKNILGLIVAGLILCLTAGLSYGVYIKVIKPRQEAAQIEEEIDPVATTPRTPTETPTRPTETGPVTFPRRALLISVHNYLYANPIVDGDKDTVNLDRFINSLSRGLRIPLTQIVHLSDAARKEPRPPLKEVIEQGLTNFLKTSRKQDRIAVFFLGHTKEIGDKAYLVPLEGEMDNASTLIPLDWVFKQLAECPARQKVLIIDGNRFNAGQGEERPLSGPMTAKFEAALKAAPTGVQVWSACSTGQQAHEFEESSVGLFLDSLRQSMTPEKGQKGPLEGKIQKPDDLLPIEALHSAVNERMENETKRRKVSKQVALLAGKAPDTGTAFDRTEKPAERPALPVIRAGDLTLVQSIMNEISLPPLKGGAATSQDVSFALLPPFPPESLEKHKGGDLPADSKFRKTIEEARAALWAVSTSTPPEAIAGQVKAFRTKLKVDLSIMRDKYGRPGGGNAENAFKTRVFEDSKAMAPVIARLERVLDDLKEVGEEKDKAPPRWQAHYMFVLARFQTQLAYLEEYQNLLGQMRRELPAHDPNIHTGFRMASKEKASDATGKKLERAARKLFSDLAEQNPKTPWEVLAKREKLTTLGLEWQAY
jgi:hypothetical protein